MTVTAASIEGRSVVPPIPPQPPVEVIVTKKGHGKISTGVHSQTYGDELYAHNEKFTVAQNLAEGLEERGYVMIIEPEAEVVKTPLKTAKEA